MKTIRAAIIHFTMFALAVTSSIACADKRKHEEKFCSALTALSDDLARLDAIGPSSTNQELQAVIHQTQKDSTAVEKEARKIGTPTAKRFMDAVTELSKETRDLPESMTVAQMQAKLEDDVRNVKQSGQALANESGCPQAMRR